ncbi:Crp/Fnr family transcriptional regulator [Taibaiella chishuiensis]|uniref:CRP-like cAMP-binding protein n=1 Tax=Taibaiella chishuiensis TaxID=1434707 RepID=A0A2P8D1U3_9BACT|nr:cyclic nucleotide-binding domain-containing protein [Taibaiella chishuiensis]PSK91161.1 CRP-like cAMP-binding protein [Taibaiella chishuiensis]
MIPEEKKKLYDFVRGLYPLQDEEVDAFCSSWQAMTVKRKTVLTVAGTTEKNIYFVLEGVQRAFFLDDNNKEATIVFTYPHSFSGVADSFLTQTPSPYFLETLTASRLLYSSYDKIFAAAEQHIGIHKMLLHATAHALKGALHRHIELQCYTSEEKFRTLMARSPHLLHLVPHKYIASYLGIDATNFSKLLSTVKI